MTQKLIESLRKEIEEALKYASLPKKKAVLALLDKFKPKLEAFLRDSVSREKVKKLIEEFPSLDESHASLPFESLLVWRAKIIEWRKRLDVLLTKKGDKTK